MTPPDPNPHPINSAIIIGGGVCGITLALSLQKLSIPFTIHEARPTQSTIGGAVNLTPSALRYLSSISVLPKILQLGYPVNSIDIFSIYTGQKHASLTFPPIDGLEHGALRIMRKDLLSALLDTLAEKGKEQVQYGKKLTSIREHEPKDDGVTAVFDDGTTAIADLIIGCDGIHSLTRTTYVDAERRSVYTGLSAAYGLLPTSSIKAPIHFADTSVNSARSGTLMASYCDKSKSTMYFTALMQIPNQADREGWRVRGADQEKLRAEVQERFREGRVQCLKEMAEKVGDMYLYPVNKLEDGDKWFRGRVLLLGDAAHAVGFLVLLSGFFLRYSFIDLVPSHYSVFIPDICRRRALGIVFAFHVSNKKHSRCPLKANQPVSQSKMPFSSPTSSPKLVARSPSMKIFKLQPKRATIPPQPPPRPPVSSIFSRPTPIFANQSCPVRSSKQSGAGRQARNLAGLLSG